MTHSSHSVQNCKAGGFSRESSVWEGLLRKQSEVSQAEHPTDTVLLPAAPKLCPSEPAEGLLRSAAPGTVWWDRWQKLPSELLTTRRVPGSHSELLPQTGCPEAFARFPLCCLDSLQQTCLRRGINFRTASSVRAELVTTRASENTFRCTCVHTPVIASNFYNGRGNVLL